jgi:hypothetical protein
MRLTAAFAAIRGEHGDVLEAGREASQGEGGLQPMRV